MKVIIAGGRDFSKHVLENGEPDSARNYRDTLQMHNAMLQLMTYNLIDEVIQGCAEGADKCGEAWAKENMVAIRHFRITKAQWEKYGKSAGPRRNRAMAQVADCLVAFWDGKSRGTKNMIEEALKRGLEIHVHRY